MRLSELTGISTEPPAIRETFLVSVYSPNEMGKLVLSLNACVS
jgi:hypothetical protein